jgi:hypothetical protein
MRRGITAALFALFALAGCSAADEESVEEAKGALEGSALTSPLLDDMTYEIMRIGSDGLQQSIGYVFASPGVDGIDQEQRWVLYQGVPLPVGYVTFKIPTVDRRFTNLGAFRAALTSGTAPVWREGATYVKVEARRYDHIPLDLPALQEVISTPQIVDELAYVHRMEGDGAMVLQGAAFGGPTRWNDVNNQYLNTEYWVTDEGYNAAVGTDIRRLRMSVVSGVKGPLNIVLDRFERGKSTLTIASCTYFKTLPSNP